MTFEDTTNVTSSPASAGGATRSGSPDGPTTDPSSRALPHASPSAPPASEPEQMILGIFGPSSTGSSASADLSSRLANKLRARLGTAGSMEYWQTWKKKVTPSGRSYWAHTASAHRTSGNGSGSSPSGWTTPQANEPDSPLGGNRTAITSLQVMAQMAGWPTPTALSFADSHQPGTNRQIEKTKELAGWPSPRANKWGMPDSHGKAPEPLAGWTTPQAHDTNPRGAGNRSNPKGGNACLAWDAKMAGWATPTQRDHKDGASDLTNTPINGLLGRQVSLSPAPTEKRGALNPAFSLWLMGYPMHWMASAPSAASASSRARATPSCPNARPNSSAPGST